MFSNAGCLLVATPQPVEKLKTKGVEGEAEPDYIFNFDQHVDMSL